MPYSDPDSDNFLRKQPRPTKIYHTDTYERISPKHFDGNGKTVLITGGATGIGKATAQAFAEAGVARLALVQRTASVLEEAKRELAAFPNTEVLTFQASIVDSARMKEILAELHQVDILVLSATATHPLVPATKLPTDEIRQIYTTNVIASFDFVNAFLALPTGGTVGYGSSKAAFAQVMQHFASELKAEEVRVFNLHPGAIWTPLVQGAGIPEAALVWEDVKLPAHFCTWLAGEKSSFLHGRFLWAQWDVDELLLLKEKVVADPSHLTIGLVQ
ncbi:hypothetical protein LTR78_009178 [Recurvomyces mirabilis]|uniref:NAD(P)-binding protein n=1 Tax=Recurvomyces mirabilis TaxID=574656 RepID=A0AAE0WIJ5_9PEZI|nr:hypothetical protein LTR78_009178 [Recurvomyces mirabilis]